MEGTGGRTGEGEPAGCSTLLGSEFIHRSTVTHSFLQGESA